MRELIDIVTEIPEIASEQGRLNFLMMVLDERPKIKQVIFGMQLSGAARPVATEIVLKLRTAGSYAPGKSYLLDFVNGLIGAVTDYEQIETLKRISQELAGNGKPTPAVLPLKAADWHGKDDASSAKSFKELVVGENTLRPFYYVRLAVEAGAAVCRISGPQIGTGFLIAPNLVMTNNHVLRQQEDLAQTELWFNYELTPDGRDAAIILVRPVADGLFHTNEQHDVSVFEIDPAGASKLQEAGVKPLPLARASAKEQERVAIIQHAGGLPKRISFQNNKVQYADREIVDYTTTTLPGSSGSPVLNDLFEVVGLHREGITIEGAGEVYHRNRGTSVFALAAWLKESRVSLTC